MGRAKFGGTKSKIRGKVGSTIYQVHKDGNHFTQMAYAAAESRVNPNTEKQARARMIMGQIQRMFNALPAIIKDSFKDVRRGQQSFNEFSRINYPLLQYDVDNHWDGGGEFDWQNKYDVVPPAGIWILSRGTLPELKPDGYRCTVGYDNEFEWSFIRNEGLLTYGQLLSRLGLDRNSYLCVLFYYKSVASGSPRIVQLNLLPNPKYPDSTDLDRMGDDEYFVYQGEWLVTGGLLYGTNEFTLSIYQSDPQVSYYVSCCALMVVKQTDRGTLFSSASFQWAQRRSFYFLNRRSPAEAFLTWYNNG